MHINVLSYLRSSVEKYPNDLALVDKNNSITYAEYDRASCMIANCLIRKGLFKQPVAVLTEKSVVAVILFLGVARSGNYYTVIDSKMPNERAKKIIETFEPSAIICDEKNINKAKELSSENSIPVLCFEDISTGDPDTDIKEEVKKCESRIIDTDILYVLFTSGSTGIPKGVIISHRSVIDYIEWAAETFGFGHDSKWGNQAPFYFDNSVLDIYSALRGGGCMYIIPQTCFSFPIRLLEYVRDNDINTVFWVPTVLSRVADLDILEKCDINCLKNILFAGEVMPAKQLNIWRRRLPDSVFANLYGPTEITVDCTYYICDREIADDEPVPIGVPCRNSDILILNNENKLASIGEKGELCVRGSSLSLGYYNNPERTEAAFAQNPLHNLYYERIYRTGDIVHVNERGEIIYDGRADSQVKHTGHRIELGEIETAVSALDGIGMNACLHKADGDQLFLFYTGNLEESEIRKRLSQSLPEYMLPNITVKLDMMPLNMNGKIDRKTLEKEYMN